MYYLIWNYYIIFKYFVNYIGWNYIIFELNIFYCYLKGLSLFNLKLVFGIIIIAVSGFGVFVNNLFVKLIIGFIFFGSIF